MSHRHRPTVVLAAVALLATSGASRRGMSQQPAGSPAPALPPPPAVPREFRAAWVTPMPDRDLRDWPSAPGLSPDSQRAELRGLLDSAAALGLNAIILHVRLAGDALYPSNYAPWSAALTGRSGGDPGYDPLAFAVAEAHARGLQLHAWFNPFRALIPHSPGPMAPSHVTRRHPEWIRKYAQQTWIDPGDPAARAFVLASILDVAKRYDVDGIHIDDYFYPYRETRTVVRHIRKRRVRSVHDIPFPDDRTWKKYGVAKGFTDRDAWRRSNIDAFIQGLYEGVKAIKPSMVVGISPFGIWRPGNPPGITGLDAFDELSADSRKWMQQGWLDYLAPQLYWTLDGNEDRFRQLDAWWRSQNPHGRYVFPGLYTSHVDGGSDPWPVEAIADEINYIRTSRAGTGDPPGEVHFRLSAFTRGDPRLSAVVAPLYRERALVPAFPWLGSAVPAAPLVSTGGDANGGVTASASDGGLSVTPGDSVRVRWWLIQTRARDGSWTFSLRGAGVGPLSLSGVDAIGTRDAAGAGTLGAKGVGPIEIAITAISATGMASTPTLLAP